MVLTLKSEKRELFEEDFIDWIFKFSIDDKENGTNMLLKCAFFGKFEVLKSFRELDLMEKIINGRLFDAVIYGCGDIKILDWLEENYGSFKHISVMASYEPAIQGQFEVLKWMHTHGYKFDETTMADAVWSNNLNIVKWLYEDVHCEIGPSSCIAAVKSGNIDMMQYLISKGVSFDIEDCLETAEEWIQPAMVEWLKTRQPKPESKTKEIIELLKKVLVLLEDL